MRHSRTATVLVWAFALLLLAAVAQRALRVSDALGRVGADRSAFARIARPLPGNFGRIVIGHRKLLDVACARHRPPAYKLCVTIGAGKVLRVHKRPLH